MEFAVFGFRLPVDRDVGIGAIPEVQKILVGLALKIAQLWGFLGR
jgi:hypothetical protein